MLDTLTACHYDAEVRPQRVMVIGGTARSLLNFRGPLLGLLRARGHEVLSVAPEDEGLAEVLRGLAVLDVGFSPLAIGRGGVDPLQDWHTARQLRRLLRRQRPDVVIAYTAKPVIYAGMALSSLPATRYYPMITGLGYAFSDAEEWRRRLLRRVLVGLYRRGLRRAHTTIFQNPDDQALFHAMQLLPANASSARVHGSGVDCEAFPPRRLPSEPVFLMLARLTRDKGVRVYVEAARLVRSIYPEARFQLAGGLDPSPSSISAEELAGWIAAGDIEYLGKLTQVQGALAGCRCFVLPSWYREGVPRSVLEAMATGRPIITTDSPGCRETVTPGVNGWRVRPRSVVALSEAMLDCIESPPERITAMAEQSLERVFSDYDVRCVNRQLIEITGL